MSVRRLSFFFDFVSPYTFLASTRIDALATAHGVPVSWEPAFLGGIMKITGNMPPAALPARAQYMFDDLHRWAALYEVPLAFSPHFPFNSIFALRVALAIRAHEGDASSSLDSVYRRYIRAAFNAAWTQNKNLGDKETVASLADHAGFSRDRALAANDDPAIKDALKTQTEKALVAGAFGMPTFVLEEGETKETYFGNDRLELIEERLKRGSPWPVRPPVSVVF